MLAAFLSFLTMLWNTPRGKDEWILNIGWMKVNRHIQEALLIFVYRLRKAGNFISARLQISYSHGSLKHLFHLSNSFVVVRSCPWQLDRHLEQMQNCSLAYVVKEYQGGEKKKRFLVLVIELLVCSVILLKLPFYPLLIKSYIDELSQKAAKSSCSNVWSSGNLIISAKK